MNLGYLDTIIAFAAVMAGASLIITALTQAVSGLLGLRGRNLKWGLEDLLRTVLPSLKGKGEQLAQSILLHPLISDSSFSRKKTVTWWRYASHIRKEDLLRLLGTWEGTLASREGAKALTMPNGSPLEQEAKAKAFADLGLPGVLMDLGAKELPKLRVALAKWFDSSMDHISQRFVSNTRGVTVAGAALVSCVFLFDSVEAWKRLSKEPELRARVIASSDALIQKADEMAVGSTSQPAMVYQATAKQLIALHRSELGKLDTPAGISNRLSGVAWLQQQFKAHQIADTNRYLDEYEALVPQAALRQASDNLNDLLEKRLVFNIIHTPYPNSVGEWGKTLWKHKWGVLASITLLSLGAPFWFNLLRTMSNLRPVLATKEEDEKKRRGEAPAGTAGTKP